MNHPIAFRPYTASDRAALIGIIREAWHYDRFASPKTAARMARLFLDSCLASQTYTQVAVSGDVPVGIIMAKDRLQHRPTFTGRLRQLRSLAALVAHREGREVMQIFADVHHIDDHLQPALRQRDRFLRHFRPHAWPGTGAPSLRACCAAFARKRAAALLSLHRHQLQLRLL